MAGTVGSRTMRTCIRWPGRTPWRRAAGSGDGEAELDRCPDLPITQSLLKTFQKCQLWPSGPNGISAGQRHVSTRADDRQSRLGSLRCTTTGGGDWPAVILVCTTLSNSSARAASRAPTTARGDSSLSGHMWPCEAGCQRDLERPPTRCVRRRRRETSTVVLALPCCTTVTCRPLPIRSDARQRRRPCRPAAAEHHLTAFAPAGLVLGTTRIPRLVSIVGSSGHPGARVKSVARHLVSSPQWTVYCGLASPQKVRKKSAQGQSRPTTTNGKRAGQKANWPDLGRSEAPRITGRPRRHSSSDARRGGDSSMRFEVQLGWLTDLHDQQPGGHAPREVLIGEGVDRQVLLGRLVHGDGPWLLKCDGDR